MNLFLHTKLIALNVPKDIVSHSTYTHVGWWVPGSLNAGWSRTYQANFNDMFDKFQQLGIQTLVQSLPGSLDVGLYFSEAEYDFLQLLTLKPRQGQPHRLPTLPIVAFSIWLASQGWAHFSPIPLLQFQGAVEHLHPVQAPENEQYPCGWYLTGSLAGAWYSHLPENYLRAQQHRDSLGLRDISPLYLTESTVYDCIQLVQAPVRPDGSSNESRVAEYVAWFAEQSFGHLSMVPFMSPALIEDASLLAGRNP